MPGGPVHILSLHHRDIWSQLLVWPIPLCCNIVSNFEQNRGTLAYIHDQDEHPGHSTMPEILTVAMSGAYRNSDELPPEVIADAFYAKRRAFHKPFWNSRAATSYCSSAPRRPS